MRYTGQDITISLDDRPDRGDGRLTINDIGTFTIWCQRFGVFFSLIEIPKGLMLSSAVSICDAIKTTCSYVSYRHLFYNTVHN